MHQVIQHTGLCICLYEILKYSDGLIGHGTGIVNVNGMQPCFLDAFTPRKTFAHAL